MKEVILIDDEQQVVVFENDREILRMKREHQRSGKIVSTFYHNGNIILVSSLNQFFIWMKRRIEQQSLEDKFGLLKSKEKYALLCKDDIFSLTRHYFKNPVFRLFRNGIEIGYVTTNMGLTSRPLKYSVTFYNQSSANFYSVISLLIFFPDRTPL